MRFLSGFAICIIIVLSSYSLVLASPDSQREQKYKDSINQLAAQLSSQRAHLESDEWDLADLEEYLYTALCFVYSGKIYANYGFGPDVAPTNADLTRLVELGYLPLWPDNPLNGWQPLQVRTPEDGFAAGELCFALCPPSYATTAGVGKQQLSFDLFIFAPTEGLGKFAYIAQHGDNKEWSTVPPDTLYGLTYCVVPDFKLEEYRKERERRRAKREGE